jgi:hypothetical protein
MLELDAEVFGDNRATSYDCDVLEDRLAPVAETGRLDSSDLQVAAQFVDDKRRKGFALHILGDDEERFSALRGRFQERGQLLQRRQLLFVDQNM